MNESTGDPVVWGAAQLVQARLHRVTAALAAASTPAEVAQAIAREGTEALGAEAGVFVAVTADGGMLEMVSCFGNPSLAAKGVGWRFSVDAPVPLAEAVRTRTPVLIASPEEVRARYPRLEELVPIRGGGLAAAPLVANDRVLGGFQFCFPEGGHPGDSDREFMLTLAPVAAQALERARLYEAAERTRAELVVSEARFRSLADALPQQVWIMDAAGQVEYFNSRALEYLGITAAQTRTIDEAGFINKFFHPDDQSRVKAAWAEAHRTLSMLEVEVRRRRADGVYRWHLNRAVPLLGPDGAVTHWFGTATDIDAQKQVESELQRSETRFRRLVETAILGVGFFGVDGTISYANEAALAITGYSREDVAAGRVNWRAITPPEYEEIDTRALAEMARTGHLAPYEKEYVRKDGSRVPILMGATLFEGSAQQGVGFIVDLTELKRVEAAHAALVERDRVFHERLIGIVGHDLKNPLGAVLASANLLLMYGEADDLTRIAVERINRSARRMSRMIDQLFDFARTRQGDSLPLEPARCDLQPLCREVIDELASSHPEARIALEAPASLVGDWDRDRLEQVISNLVGNAIDHGTDGAITVRVIDEADAARLEVHNFGPPIPPADLPHVFDPYRRARAKGHTTSRNLGLGLYIVREVVRAHLGAIEVRSTADEGTCFTVRLPRSAPVSAAG